MANPKGNLAGFTDKSEPGWEERVIAAVKARPTNDRRKMVNSSTFRADKDYLEELDRQANLRGLTRSGYIRRCVTAILAFDSGRDFKELAAQTAHPMAKHMGYYPTGTMDDGAGGGNWIVQGLTEVPRGEAPDA